VARILIYSTTFPPNVGGLETISFLIARELARLGHEVTVFTPAASKERDVTPFLIVRSRSWWTFLRTWRKAQVVLYFNVSLKGIWPLLIVRRPVVISHHGPYRRPSGKLGLRDWIKYRLASHFENIAVSGFVAQSLEGKVTVVPNAYDNELFRLKNEIERNYDFVFVGRLVNDKGADDFIKALARIIRNPPVTASVVGDGPFRRELEELVRDLELQDRVTFCGIQTGEALVDAVNRHRILVVPSQFQEPFGIVALEGIACGCIVIGSQGGGLTDAIGPCGMTYPIRDVGALSAAMREILDGGEKNGAYYKNFHAHLAIHKPAAVAQQYEKVLIKSCREA